MKVGASFLFSLCMLLTSTAAGSTQEPEARVLDMTGDRYLEQGMYELAIKEYKEAIRLRPWNTDAHMMLGIAYYCQGAFDLATKQFENSIKLSDMGRPGDAWPFATMQILSLQRARRPEEAWKLLQGWSRGRGKIKHEAKYLLGKWEDKRFLKKAGKRWKSHANLIIGVNYLVKGDVDAAKRALQLVVGEPAWCERVAEAELERIENCGQTPCSTQVADEQVLFTIEIGRPEELRDIRTAYVHASGQDRENILKALGKYEGITVLDTFEGEKPDVILVFESERSSRTDWGFTEFGGSSRTVTKVLGRGKVIRFNNEHAMRILWRFEDARENLFFERPPSINFARDFTNLLKELRNEK